MESKQIRAIREQLGDIDQRGGLLSQADVGHLLSLTRQLMESQRISSSYPHLKLYCDWSVHPSITHSLAGLAVLTQVARLLNESRTSEKPQIVDAKHGVSAVLDLEKLRSEWECLYEENEIFCGLLNGEQWQICCARVLELVSDKKIEFPKKPSGKWKRAYDEVVELSEGDERWVIQSLHVHNDLSDEQRKFYNIPEGAYVWQLKTTADISLCSVLYYVRPTSENSERTSSL